MTVTKEYLQKKYKNYIKINELKNGKYFIYQKNKTNCDYFNFVTNDLEKAEKKINKWIYKNYNQIISDEVKQNNSSITVTCEIDIPECVKIKRLILIFRLKTYEEVLKVYSDSIYSNCNFDLDQYKYQIEKMINICNKKSIYFSSIALKEHLMYARNRSYDFFDLCLLPQMYENVREFLNECLGENNFLSLKELDCAEERYSLEKRAKNYFLLNKIDYESQKTFSDLKVGKTFLRYDFFIPEKKVLIEMQGEQHYKAIGFWGGEDGYKKRMEYDELKRKYANENGYKLLEIKYNEEVEKKLEYYLETA